MTDTVAAGGSLPTTSFGAGHAEPYESALRAAASRVVLRDIVRGRETRLDLGRYLAAPTAGERRLVEALPAPILDVGCGPGRMLEAARSARREALGVDVSPASVAIAASRGLQAIRRSVFDPIPDEGSWGAVLLLDGNIGIGGDPGELLERCAALVRPAGRVVIETHARRRRDRRFEGIIVGVDGATSLPFRWAEVGASPLRTYAGVAGFRLLREWRARGRRAFAEYERR
jgi:SAM-dependent methyltransferase